MNLKDAFKPIAPVIGLTSLIGAPGSIAGCPPKVPTLVEARDHLKAVKEAQDRCTSDAAYWGYAGQIGFWATAVDILEAAEITGPDNLPDVDPPDLKNCLVMDAIGRMKNYGAAIRHAVRGASR